MITRRQLLMAGLSTLALAGLGTAGADVAAKLEITAIVRRRLNYLTLDDQGVRQFAHDQVAAWIAKRPTWNRLKYHMTSLFAKHVTRFQRSADNRSRQRRIEDSLISTYLLSSDFFVHQADETRAVQYIALYDAMRGCGNPFARPAVDPQAS